MKDLATTITAETSGYLLSQMGYTSDEVEDFHASGIAAVDLSCVSEESSLEIVGSNPIDLFSSDASLHLLRAKPAPKGVILIDFYSGAAFRPIHLCPLSLFGPMGLDIQISSTLPRISPGYRWRFNRIPTFVASTESDLEKIAASIAMAVPRSDHMVFRGQVQPYEIPRSATVREFLYGDASAREPSLLTTAFRHRFSYVSAERYWHGIIADIDYRLTGYKDKRWYVEDRFEYVKVGVDGNITRWHCTSTMAIAQHYGVPTYGLDVTRSIKTAWWFATHVFQSVEGSICYSPYTWKEQDRSRWPVIYVLETEYGVDIAKLELPARRPEYQNAVFVNGGWGPHGNICADDLVAVIALAPEIGIAPNQVANIFPPPIKDPMYEELLKLKFRLTPNHPLFIASGLQYIFDLHYE